jgi:hypothetical protein
MIETRRTTRRKSFMPYRYDDRRLRLSITGYEVDGELHTDGLDETRQRVDLTQFDDWERVRFNLEVKLPEAVITEVFPEQERDSPPGALVVALSCDDTYQRKSQLITRHSLTGTTTETISVTSDGVRNKLTIEPFLVRTTVMETPEPGYATELGARLAGAREWEVAIDEQGGPSGTYLQIEYRSFREWEYNGIEPDSVYYLDVDADPEPLLHLNSDHDRLKRVLDSDGTTGPRARMRDAVFYTISTQVWSQLFLRAASVVTEDGETPRAWQQGVLEQFLSKIYPERDREATLAQIRATIHEDGDPAALLQRADMAIQDGVTSRKLADVLAKLTAEVVE